MEALLTIKELLDTHFEWLAVHESGRTLPLRRDEIEISLRGGRVLLGYTDDAGFRERRVHHLESDGSEFAVTVGGAFGSGRESVRFVPRESAAALAAGIEAARLAKANETAAIIKAAEPAWRPARIELAAGNSRYARITFDTGGQMAGVLTDVTASAPHEGLLAAALDWLERERSRRRGAVREIRIAAEKRQARALQKLLAVLRGPEAAAIGVVQIDRSGAEPAARLLRRLTPADLWRERPAKLVLPAELETSETAEGVIGRAPDKMDVVFSRRGETVRFNGLPFLRVRRLLGRERAWFGTGGGQRPLNDETREELYALLDGLHRYRDAMPPSRRHDLYRMRPESWLESLLRRNIKQLDANLVLAPIYNQFRTAADKIDLLAIRRDGRLVVIEVKASPDRGTVFQAADYWRKIELQRRRGVLAAARLFGDIEIADRPALIYIAAPALSFHPDTERHARMLVPEAELWRWELREDWRNRIRVIRRLNYT